ncbi:CBR1 [Cervus elaphus hippelaphus]|uniref:CBR1 n=1 Tax=Cervus elaphus hippelaphus TaxID=46360 RepID=A0A212CII5_CEREH|nr:CBR1 [Cervus elaphus hippelaphus]
MKTNFFGTRNVCQTELLPLIKPQGRVVNVSSFVSVNSLKKCSPELQQKFQSETITEEELVGLMNKCVEDTKSRVHRKKGGPDNINEVTNQRHGPLLKPAHQKLQQKLRSETISEEELVGLMNKFVEDTKSGVHRKEGWPNTTYGVTKIGVTVLSRIQTRKLSEQRGGDKILLNACCPGLVRTNTAGPKVPKSPEEGAETLVYLALLPSDAEGPHGEFVSEKKVVDSMPVPIKAEMTMKTNFFGTRDICTELLPLMKPQGWVRTDMGGPKAYKSLEEGIETPVYLALLPSDAEGPHGQFVHEKKVAKWQFMPQFYPKL